MSDEIKPWSTDRIERGLALTKYDLFWIEPFAHVGINVDDLIQQKLEEKEMINTKHYEEALYEVVVENVGTVINTADYEEAERMYQEYVEYSKYTPTTNQVTLFGDSEIILEFECLEDTGEDLEEGEVMVGMPVTRRDISKHNGKIPADIPIAEYYPYTIIEVINKKTIIVQADDYYLFNAEKDLYKYVRNPNGVKMRLSLRFNDLWYVVGHSIHHTKISFYVGKRERHTQHGQ